MPSAECLQLRIRMLERRHDDLEETAKKVATYRRRLADLRNERNKYRQRPGNAQLAVGDVVLVWDQRRKVDMSLSRKLTYRWDGPFIIARVADKGVYFLKTPDNVELRGTFPPTRLKKFVQDKDFWIAADGEEVNETFNIYGEPPMQTAPVSPDQTPIIGDEDVSAKGDEEDIEMNNEVEGESVGEERDPHGSNSRLSTPVLDCIEVAIPDRYRELSEP